MSDPYVQIAFTFLDDPVKHEWQTDGPEVERYWLPAIGPTSIVLMRRICPEIRQGPFGFYHVPEVEISQALGLGRRQGKNAPLRRTLERLTNFGFGRIDDTWLEDYHVLTFQLREYIRPPGKGVQNRYPEFLKPQLMEAINAAVR